VRFEAEAVSSQIEPEARIALMAHRGDSTQAIAAALDVSQQTATKWRPQPALRGKDALQERTLAWFLNLL
jgi:transposase